VWLPLAARSVVPWYELKIYRRQPGGPLVGHDAPIFEAEAHVSVLYDADQTQLGTWNAVDPL
jgi:hypothetical protein